MLSLDNYYPDMSEFPAHEYCCARCGALLELPTEEQDKPVCEECEESDDEA